MTALLIFAGYLLLDKMIEYAASAYTTYLNYRIQKDQKPEPPEEEKEFRQIGFTQVEVPEDEE